MKKKFSFLKNFSCKHALAMLAAFAFAFTTACTGNTGNSSTPAPTFQIEPEKTPDSTASVYAEDVQGQLFADFSERDLDYTYDENEAISIEFKNGSADGLADCDGVVLNGDVLTVKQGGVYVLSGTFKGSVHIDVQNTEKVQLVLNGVNIESNNGPAIYAMQSDKIFVTLPEGSENTLTDSTEYSNLDDDNEPSAALFSKDDMTLNGTGTLNVNANYMHGIISKDDLSICGAVLNVSAPNTAIRGKDELDIKDANITVNANTNGLDSNNDSDETKGNIIIENSVINISSAGDAVQAVNNIQLTSAVVTLTSGGGAADITNTGNGEMDWNKDGKPLFGHSTENFDETDNSDDTESTKGIKCGKLLRIDGGTFKVDSYDDAIHSNGDIVVADADLSLSSSDDGMHADNGLYILSGNINVEKSYEGLEGSSISIYDGTICIKASDDGINAAGGADGSGLDGMNRFGHNKPDSFDSGDSDGVFIKIMGGNIYVDASGDGIDSNGTLSVSGGLTIVEGPTSNGNGALDYLGNASIEGGTFIAFGSSGMALNFTDVDGQCAALVNFKSTQEAGTPIAVYDANGNFIFAANTRKSYSSVLISSPELICKNTYDLKYAGSMTNDFSTNESDYSGGSTYTTLDFSTEILNINSNGGENFGGFGDKKERR